MTPLDQQHRNVLIFLSVVILAGSGYWMLRHFQPALFLGEPDLIVAPESQPPSTTAPLKTAPKPQPPEMLVHVAGAVQSPGVYRLSPEARVQDAIEKAGGGTDAADLHRLNLAAKIRDGQQIYVPELSQTSTPDRPILSSSGPPLNALPSADGLIDLNTATLEQLQALPRIGPVTAGRIIEYRATYGPFSTIDDLVHVKGIGEKTLEKIRPLVVVY